MIHVLVKIILVCVCACVCAPSTTTRCANLDLLLRVIQTFLGLGGAAPWSLFITINCDARNSLFHCESAR